ncbi:MAG: hypothetical protein LBJ67_08030, partial [Planctomycetaceae bacterium]|nr:hypothetical protein [Planctomycetaceae bacterium]
MLKNKKICSAVLFCLLQILFLNFAQNINAQPQNPPTQNSDFTVIEKNFVAPPENFRTGTYWYWMSNHISKEGVIKDLQSMKKAGINWVILGSDIVSGTDKYFGKVKVFSPEWYEIMHTTLKTATELDIEVGLFNSPGWSQSGGPWVKPENSMRYLATSETRVKGPAKIEQKLPQPTEHFQDVKVVAVPVASDYLQNLLSSENTRVSTSDNIQKPQPSQEQTKYILPQDESSIEVTLPKAGSARSLTIYPAGTFVSEIELQAKEGEDYRTVKRFTMNRKMDSGIGNDLLFTLGFDPLAPVAVSFAEIESKAFRIVFRRTRNGSSIKDVVLSATPKVERYAEKTFAKMNPGEMRHSWNGYLWDRQPDLQNITVADPKQVIDISQYMGKNGVLNWDAPEGEWLILRTGMAPTNVTNTPPSPEGKGLEVDKMSKKHVAMHFDAFIGDIMKRVPAEDRKSLKMIVMDSYETGGQNFTDDMIDAFKARYGYDPVPFFPVYSGHVIGNPDMSDRFLWDVRRLIADKISYDYVGGMREISHKHGLVTWLENYGYWGFPGEFLQYGGQSDEVGGEFWSATSPSAIGGWAEPRLASSCAHIYGKRKVHAESFTSGGFVYGRHPAHFKASGDWSFAEGINSTVLTLFIHQPYEDIYPGIDAWFGSEIHRKNTWFGQADVYLQYIKRCNYILQQGLNVADVAYFIGEDTPKMNGIRNPELPKGYSFDYINAEVILRDLAVKDGRFVLPHGTSYRVLVLPPMETMTPELLQKIEQLTDAGGIILGQPPKRSPSLKNYPNADEQIKSLSKKMWNDTTAKKREYGKGLVLSDMSMAEVFALLNVTPDFLTDSKTTVLYNHRTVDGKEIYFVSNQSDKPVTFKAQFRVNDLQPELWNAVTGEIRLLPEFEQSGEITSVPLKLDAFESAFVVFHQHGNPASNDVVANYPEPNVRIPVNGVWEVRFESDEIKRGATEIIKFNELQDWTKSEDIRIKYFSG